MSRLFIQELDVEVVRAEMPHVMPLGVLREDLLRLGQVAEIGKLSLLGDEPTRHPDIDEMLAMCRSTNIARAVSLVTSGQFLDRMSVRFWRIIRKIEIDVFPGKLPGHQIVWIQHQCRVHSIDLKIMPGAITHDGPRLDFGRIRKSKAEAGLALDGISEETLKAYLETA